MADSKPPVLLLHALDQLSKLKQVRSSSTIPLLLSNAQVFLNSGGANSVPINGDSGNPDIRNSNSNDGNRNEANPDTGNSTENSHNNQNIINTEDSNPVLIALQAVLALRNAQASTLALDAIAKLISASEFFPLSSSVSSSSPQSSEPLADKVTAIICSALPPPSSSSAQDDNVSLQIIKSLLCVVLASPPLVHGQTLVEAIKTVYSIYTASHHSAQPSSASASSSTTQNTSNNSSLQAVSKGALGQMCEHVFSRIADDETTAKDALTVFKIMCKLSVSETSATHKSLSLSLISTLLHKHLPDGARHSLFTAISKNAYTTDTVVFTHTADILAHVIKYYRSQLKAEIGLLLDIFLPILDMKNSSVKLKLIVLNSILRAVCADAQILVDLYINYDCDSNSSNVFERIVNSLAKLAYISAADSQQSFSNNAIKDAAARDHRELSRTAFTCLVESTHALRNWAEGSHSLLQNQQQQRQSVDAFTPTATTFRQVSPELQRNSSDNQLGLNAIPSSSSSSVAALANENAEVETLNGESYSNGTTSQDDPSMFETFKQRKILLQEGIRQFNIKPKRGINYLIANKFIDSNSPHDIAKFLLTCEGLSKAMIGEYLGEGEEENILCMHSFVDQMNFNNLEFTAALRLFLQSFRLPGESQKIDRYMLKFAERFVKDNSTDMMVAPNSNGKSIRKNPVFANADTAYVMAYSVVMLNTDAYNTNLKKRMSKEDFIKNNRGINDGQNLPDDYLSSIYDDIHSNEIRMKDEAPKTSQPSSTSIASVLANAGRNFKQEEYILQSEGRASRSEAIYKNLVKTQKRTGSYSENFVTASHSDHAKPMFEVSWTALLSGISETMKNSDEPDLINLCMEGSKSAIKISCHFGIDLICNAFVTALANFTDLGHMGEMKVKSVESIRTILEVATTNGNDLGSAWRPILTCVSQLGRLHMIVDGHVEAPQSNLRKSLNGNRKSIQSHRIKSMPDSDIAEESKSSDITRASEMIFSSSKNLSGTAIVDFVKALSQVSWEEIAASGMSANPRMFSLQKLVEISYYNMGRIRLEWSNIWQILGSHFNKVCCHSNSHVFLFGLDSLRQLAMRFLEKEELANFKFQKDFLTPFEYTMIHNSNRESQEMILQCMSQMIQARQSHLRSGWSTMFGVFSSASKVAPENLANFAFLIVEGIQKSQFDSVIQSGSFGDLALCITEFCKVRRYQKVSLHAINMLRSTIPAMMQSEKCPIGSKTPFPPLPDGVTVSPQEDPMIQYWFPILFGFYDVIMNCEDLEVRKIALQALFEALSSYGNLLRLDFWNTICEKILFPIFSALRSTAQIARFSSQEDMSVWLSTTMVQALRNLVELYTQYFETLEFTLGGLLDLLSACVCQEDDTLARIGTSCLQNFLQHNAKKLSSDRWSDITNTFIYLFKTTTAHQLFDSQLLIEPDASNHTALDSTESNGIMKPALLAPSPSPSRAQPILRPADRKRIFKQMIVKCVLQLLLIEMMDELLQNNDVYNTIPPQHLLKLLTVLDDSYKFAEKFNNDKDLRLALFHAGFMKQMPSLLRQESSSSGTLAKILTRMYADDRDEHTSRRDEICLSLIPLCANILQSFSALDVDSQSRNVAAWQPVVANVINSICQLQENDFLKYMSQLYILVTDLFSRELSQDIRIEMKQFFTKVDIAYKITTRNEIQ